MVALSVPLSGEGDLRLCPNCGGLTLLREAKGWACWDPDCLRYLNVVQLDDRLLLPPFILVEPKKEI